MCVCVCARVRACVDSTSAHMSRYRVAREELVGEARGREERRREREREGEGEGEMKREGEGLWVRGREGMRRAGEEGGREGERERERDGGRERLFVPTRRVAHGQRSVHRAGYTNLEHIHLTEHT